MLELYFNVDNEQVKMRKSETFYVKVVCKPYTFRPVNKPNSTRNSLQACVRLRRYTAATLCTFNIAVATNVHKITSLSPYVYL